MIKPRIWFGKEDIATTEWKGPRSRIVNALVACYKGRIGYKEACFSLDLFIISSSSFASLFCLSYLILHFRLIIFRLFIPFISLSSESYSFISAIYNQPASIRI